MKCLNPLLSKRSIPFHYVPCGQCYYCRLRVRNEWVCRILLEKAVSKSSFFVTLTYDNEHLPDNFGVNREHIKSFIDSLRRRFLKDGVKMRFYLMSEYGGRTKRPHYHAHIFLDRDVDKQTFYNYLVRYWKHGFVHVGRTTIKSVFYTTKFHVLPKEHFHIYPVKNFHVVSSGLGSEWVNRYGKWYLDNSLKYFQIGDRKMNFPNYIAKKIGFLPSDPQALNLFSEFNSFADRQHHLGVFGVDVLVNWEDHKNFLNSSLIVKGLNDLL